MTAHRTSAVWMFSPADGFWHAFPPDDAADKNRTSYTALCGHSVPADQVRRGEPKPALLHLVCLIAYGEPLPTNHQSEVG